MLKDMSERRGRARRGLFRDHPGAIGHLRHLDRRGAARLFLDMRDKRVMRAEEKGKHLATKLTLGTMMFTVPPLMIILIGPLRLRDRAV